MAFYDYKCPKGHIHSETRAMSEDQQVHDCPKCGEKLTRVYDSISAIFKGSGFYSTGR